MAIAREELLIAIRGSAEDFQRAAAEARRELDRVANVGTRRFRTAHDDMVDALERVKKGYQQIREEAGEDTHIRLASEKAERDIDAFIMKLRDIPVEKSVFIKAELQKDYDQMLFGMQRGLDGLGRRFRAASDEGLSATDILRRLFFLIKGLTPLLAGLGIILMTAVVPGLLAVGSSAIGAVGGLAALGTAALGLLAPLAAVGGALFSRFQKVLEARKAREQANEAATKAGARATANAAQVAAQRAAQEQSLRDAIQARERAERAIIEARQEARREIGEAERNLAEAQREAANAADEMARATTQAYREIRDAADEARRSVLDLREAQLGITDAKLDLKEAQLALRKFRQENRLTALSLNDLFKKFEDVNVPIGRLKQVIEDSTGVDLDAEKQLELERIIQRIRHAKLGEKQATERLRQAQQDLNDAQKESDRLHREGIKGTDVYRGAQERLREANRQLAESQREVNELRRRGVDGAPAVVAAVEALADAEERLALVRLQNKVPVGVTEAATAAENAKQKFEELTEAEQAFADAIDQLGKKMSGALKPATDAIFEGLAGILNLAPLFAQRFIPALNELGGALRDVMKDFGLFLFTDDVGNGLEVMAENAGPAMRLLGDILQGLFRVLLNIGRAAMPAFMSFLGFLKDSLQGMGDATSDVTNTAGPINAMAESFRTWVRFLGRIVKFFIRLAEVAGPFGDELIEWLGEGVDKLTEWLKSAEGQAKVKEFFENTIPAVKAVVGFIGALIKTFLAFFNAFGPVIAGIVTGITPIFDVLTFIFNLISKIPAPLRMMGGLFLGFGFAGKVLTGIFRLIGRIVTWIATRIPRAVNGLIGPFRQVFSWIGGRFTWLFDRVRGLPGVVGRAFRGAGNAIARIGTWIWGKLKGIGEFFRNAFNTIIRIVGNAIRPIIDRIKRIASGIGDAFAGISKRIRNVFKGIIAFLKGVINGMIDVLNWFIGKFNSVFRKRKIEGPGPLPDITFPGIEIPKIPHLAEGGMATSATLALIGEKTKEAVLPLRGDVMRALAKAITDNMRLPQMNMGAAMAGLRGGGEIHQHFIIPPAAPANPQPDARITAALLAQELRRRGHSGAGMS